MFPQQAAARAATPHADQIPQLVRALDNALSETDETGAPIGPAVDHLTAIITAAENALAALNRTHPTTT